jgi:demethylmenaquinone methyltransferase/2-methoxy-6-polyprenyl-1,4-benzoquinol methylase
LTLRSTISTPQGKRRFVRALFATIAPRYDFITRFLSYGRDRYWKRRSIELAAISPDDRVLDLACGTGDVLFEAAQRSQHVVGVDVTLRMLQQAQRRAVKARPTDAVGRPLAGRRDFIAGDMLALPFGRSSFEVITTGYGLRNVPDLALAISEIHRVLKPGGRFVSLDFNRPANRLVRAAYLTYLTLVGSVLGFVLHGDPNTYRYIPESIRQYPGADAVAELIERAGFRDVRIVPLLGGLMAIHTARRF